MPVQSPDQPAKVAAPCGVAVSVTDWLNGNEPVHVVGQPMAAVGAEVTVPEALPARVTASVCGPALNVAVTLRTAVTVKVQLLPLTESQPFQLADEPLIGAAVNVTCVLWLTVSEQLPGQLMPTGSE